MKRILLTFAVFVFLETAVSAKTLCLRFLQSSNDPWCNATLSVNVNRGGRYFKVKTDSKGIARVKYRGGLPVNVKVYFNGRLLKDATWSRDEEEWTLKRR